ncbi:MAG: hypothetical protein Q4G04_06460 [bacterium]|nr:hypothetical protein [bacterium]
MNPNYYITKDNTINICFKGRPLTFKKVNVSDASINLSNSIITTASVNLKNRIFLLYTKILNQTTTNNIPLAGLTLKNKNNSLFLFNCLFNATIKKDGNIKYKYGKYDISFLNIKHIRQTNNPNISSSKLLVSTNKEFINGITNNIRNIYLNTKCSINDNFVIPKYTIENKQPANTHSAGRIDTTIMITLILAITITIFIVVNSFLAKI